jgi:hypothetical protein
LSFIPIKPLRERRQQLGGWRSPALVLIAIVTIWDLSRMLQALDQVVEKVLATPALTPTPTSPIP